MKNISQISFIFVLFLIGLSSQANTLGRNPKPLPIGIYVSDISDINFKLQTIDVIFWVWSTQETPNKNFGKELIVVNAISQSIIKTVHTKLGENKYRSVYGIKVKLHEHFLLKRYPLNDQLIELDFEDMTNDVAVQYFQPEHAKSYIGENANYLPDWSIGSAYWKVDEHAYGKTYSGNNAATYSRATYYIELTKEPVRSIINVFGVTFLTFVLGFCIFLVPRSDLRVRLSLIVACVFAVVGNAIASQASVPATTQFTLADQIFSLGVVALAINLLLIFIIYFFEHKKIIVTLNRFGLIWSGLIIPGIIILMLTGLL